VWSAQQAFHDAADWSRRSLGGPGSGLLDGIAIVPNHDGRLESVVVGEGYLAHPGTVVWHVRQTRPGGGWSGWESLAAPPGTHAFRSAVAQDQTGRLEVLTRTFDGKMWHRRQAQPGDDQWERWRSLDVPAFPAGFMEPPAVVRNHSERLEVFTIATGGLYHRWQTPSDNDWSEWKPLKWPGGGIVAGESFIGDKSAVPATPSPVLVRGTDGWLSVLIIAFDRSIWHRRQRPGGEWDQWRPFRSHPGWLTELAAGTQPDGGLVLFAISRRPDNRTELWLGQVRPGFDWEQPTWKLFDTLPQPESASALGAA
jgi:hypothetical protein